MNNTLHVIDDRCDPDPMTEHGTTDLVAFFYRLKFLARPFKIPQGGGVYHGKGPKAGAKNKKDSP